MGLNNFVNLIFQISFGLINLIRVNVMTVHPANISHNGRPAAGIAAADKARLTGWQ